MLKIFEKNIHKVRVRCSINLLLNYAGQILIIAGIIAILAVLIEKLLALHIINQNTLIGFGVISSIQDLPSCRLPAAVSVPGQRFAHRVQASWKPPWH